MKFLELHDAWVEFGYCDNVTDTGYACKLLYGHDGDHLWFTHDTRGVGIPPINSNRLRDEPAERPDLYGNLGRGRYT